MVILLNKRAICLLVLLIFLFSLGFGSLIFFLTQPQGLIPVTSDQPSLADKKIVIDPGHGGIDGGSSHDNLLEKEINLTLARRLKKYLTKQGVKVKLTRTKDQALDHLNDQHESRHRRDLQARVDIIEAEQPELFISLHVNYFAGNSSLRGPICFYQADNTDSNQLAQAVQNQLNKLEQIPDNSSQPGDYFLLNNCQVTGILIEMGFLNQAADRKLLTDDQFQQQLVRNIYYGLLKFYESD